MDEDRYRLRDLVDADFPALARIWTRSDPVRPITGEEVRSMFQSSSDPRFVRHRRSIVEVASNEVVATGSLWQSSFMYDPKFAFAGISVDPDHQHRGLGRRLFEDLEGAARTHGLQGLWAGVRADEPRSVRFFEAAGFREKRRRWISKLDVHELPADLSPRSPDRWAADGIVFSTIQEEGPDRPEVRERLFQLYGEAMKDTPRIGGKSEDSRGWFDEFFFRGPGYLPEAMFVARAGDTYVSFSLLYRQVAEADTLHISVTGTLPAYRGRGLARELKRRSIEYARSHSYRYIQTDNDSENPRIWSINQQLGFRQFRVLILGEKELRP
jgi:ribosomal protein S18 acetylase RimI-like enzyme